MLGREATEEALKRSKGPKIVHIATHGFFATNEGCLSVLDGSAAGGYDPMLLSGLVLSGASPDGQLVEVVELEDHPWFVGSQFHPEFKSTPFAPHPLFTAFVGAAIKHEAGS